MARSPDAAQRKGVSGFLCARRLRDTGDSLHLHGALVGLAAQGAVLGAGGWGGCHVKGVGKYKPDL